MAFITEDHWQAQKKMSDLGGFRVKIFVKFSPAASSIHI